MSEIYRTDEAREEKFNKEYVKHVESRMRRAQIRRMEQKKKNMKLCIIGAAIIVLLIFIIILVNACSNGKKNTGNEITTPEITSVPERTTVEETTLVAMYTIDVLNLRAQPNTNSEIIVQLAAGKKVEIISEEGKWCKVKRGKDEGYVMKKYLSYTNILY